MNICAYRNCPVPFFPPSSQSFKTKVSIFVRSLSSTLDAITDSRPTRHRCRPVVPLTLSLPPPSTLDPDSVWAHRHCLIVRTPVRHPPQCLPTVPWPRHRHHAGPLQPQCHCHQGPLDPDHGAAGRSRTATASRRPWRYRCCRQLRQGLNLLKQEIWMSEEIDLIWMLEEIEC
jgi:hypothetical protein